METFLKTTFTTIIIQCTVRYYHNLHNKLIKAIRLQLQLKSWCPPPAIEGQFYSK